METELQPVDKNGIYFPPPKPAPRARPERLAATLNPAVDPMCGCLGFTCGVSFSNFADFDANIAKLEADECGEYTALPRPTNLCSEIVGECDVTAACDDDTLRDDSWSAEEAGIVYARDAPTLVQARETFTAAPPKGRSQGTTTKNNRP